ncbi:MAG: nicotinate-nucleotide--dimethylbenzimidazole phosphoribosyltransferase [Micromonosporaceae bacterium]|jgi:nicotinate-nucleotide--dimethylbenzimidazole phosphoribosyltransferase
MADPGWRTALVLGGTGSGRSAYAASLLAGVGTVRQVTPGDGDDLATLARLVAAAGAGDALLVDGLDAWLPRPARTRPDPGAQVAALATALRDTAARVVLVSPELGLAPPGGAGAPARVAAVADLNRAVAEAVDAVVFVLAGQPLWLKGAPPAVPGTPAARAAAGPAAAVAPPDRPTGPGRADADPVPDAASLPRPDVDAAEAASRRLAGSGLGALTAAVTFAAATQADPVPQPWRKVRTLVLHGDHRGATAAGDDASADRAAAVREGGGPLGYLAGQAGSSLLLVECPPAAPVEDGPAAGDDEIREALRRGRALTDAAVDEGVDALALAATGAGSDTAAAGVVALLATGTTEPAGLLGRVRAPDGSFDDAAWIRRCTALRDAAWRTLRAARQAAGVRHVAVRPTEALAAMGGADIATAAGVILGAAARRTPVLLDGPVGAAAALAARGLAAPAVRWCLLVDHGGHPTVVQVAEQLRLNPVLDLRLGLGEGAAVLAALPLLRAAATLAGAPVPPDRV